MKLKLKSVLLNKRLLNIIFVFMIVFLLFTKKEKITGEREEIIKYIFDEERKTIKNKREHSDLLKNEE